MPNVTQLLEQCRSNKQLFLALDRDGTLVPYAKRPEEAIMPDKVRSTLNSLADLPNVVLALVSARGNARLKDDIDAPKIILAGNYGMEIRLPEGQEFIAPGALQAVPELRRLYPELLNMTKDFAGIILEDDFYTFCLHWHLTPQEQREALHQSLLTLKAKLNTVVMRSLPTSYEFLPNIPWNKAYALETILTETQLVHQDYLYVYIGDTAQDEPAFEWVNDRGGLSIKVGQSNSPTQAKYLMAEPADVALFLEQLLTERSLLNATAYDASEDPELREKKIEAVFADLRKTYAPALPKKIKELEALVEATLNKPGDLVSLAEARMQVHRTKGTVGTYGFKEISSLLQEVETALEDIEQAQLSNDQARIKEVWQKAIPIIEDKFAQMRADIRD